MHDSYHANFEVAEAAQRLRFGFGSCATPDPDDPAAWDDAAVGPAEASPPDGFVACAVAVVFEDLPASW